MPIRRRLTPLAILATFALLVSGCAALEGEGTEQDAAAVSVAAGFYPLVWATEQVGGERVRVTSLTRPGQDAHDDELSLSNTAELSEADLVLLSGDFQPSVADAVEANATGQVLDVADVITLLPVHDHDEDHGDEDHGDEDHDGHDHGDEESHEHGDGDGHDSHDGHDHGDEDPHFWLDPLLMAQIGEAVATQLGELDPENADEYVRAAEDLGAELSTLDQEYTEGLSSCERSTVVVSHDAFGYLRRYGLAFEPVAGLSPGAEPTPAGLRHLTQVIEAEGITTIFNETLSPTKLTEQLAADRGITTAVLDPVEGLPEESDDDYFSLMRSNLDALKKANQC